MTTLGPLIRRERRRQRLRQIDLANAVGISLKTLQRIEAGDTIDSPAAPLLLDHLGIADPTTTPDLSDEELRPLVARALRLADDAQLITEVAARFARRGSSHTASPPIPPGPYRIVTDPAGHVTAVPFDPAAETGEKAATGDHSP